MPAQMNWAGVTVTIDGESYPNVQAVVRKGTARVSRLGQVNVEKQGVVAVHLDDTLHARIEFADSTIWPVLRAARRGGCGCR